MAATACESPYYASSAIPTRLGSNIRRSSLIFQPPRTPAGNDDSFYFHMRKRVRADSNHNESSNSNLWRTPTADVAAADSWMTLDSARAASPAPLANTRYCLAGGFDTPTLATAVHFDINDAQRDINFRSKWDTTSLSTPEQSYVSGPLARERNGKSRLGNNSSTAGWGTFVFSLVSGAAGRMWDLCLSTAPFLGFYAGGGEGYAFPSSSQSPASNDLDASYFRLPTPMSGKYPPGLGEWDESTTPPRPAKRIHTDTGAGWVVVDQDLQTHESPRLSIRKISAGSTSYTSNRSVSSASTADPRLRKSLIPVSRRSSSHVSHTGSPSLQAVYHSPTQQPKSHQRSASTASMRSPSLQVRTNSTSNNRPGSRHSYGPASPLSPEAQRFLLRQEKQDRAADKSMRKMSRQVQALIRQGQAALGTKVEVEDENEQGVDEGFEDGEW